MSAPSTPAPQPAPLTPQQQQQCWNVFVDSLHKVFNNWTALTLAVEHGFGGASSRNKADMLMQETIKFFQNGIASGKRVYPDELATNFETFMMNDMRTDCEDGSCSEVSELLCDVLKECYTGNFEQVQKMVGGKTTSTTQSQYLNPEGISSSDDEGDDGDSSEHTGEDADMMEAEEPPKPQPPQKVIDDDGFETVTRKRGPRR